MIGVAAVGVIPEEVPRPREQRVVVLSHHEAVLQIDTVSINIYIMSRYLNIYIMYR